MTKTQGTPIDTKEIEVYRKQIATAEKFSQSLEVKNDDDYQSALSEGKTIKEHMEMIVSRKEEITKPMNAALKSVRDLFKPLEMAGETALATIKRKMLSFTNKKQRKAEEERLKLAKKVETGYMKPETAVARMDAIKEQPKTVVTENGSSTTKTVTKYRVTDKKLVPLDFMEVDMVKVKASFRAGMAVAGCEAYEEKELSLIYNHDHRNNHKR
jgi:hypothetical protein